MKNRSLIIGLALLGTACAQEIEEAPLFQIVPATQRDIIVSASAAGSIEPIQTVEVKSKASGEITAVAVESGDQVSRGALLVRVDPRVPRNAVTQAQADLDVAQAQLTNAQAQLNRSEALYESQSITEQEYENARLSFANANAQLVRATRSLEDAQIAYEDTEVRAPINGTVIERSIEIGTVIASATNNVSGGAVLMRMANLDTVQVRSLVDETDIGKITPGLPVTIHVEAYPSRRFEGRVLKVEPQAVEQQSVTMFPVLVRIPNPENLLKPGMNAEVEYHIGNAEQALAIPNAALRSMSDVAISAQFLGLDPEAVQSQLAERNDADVQTAEPDADSRTITIRGQQIEVPESVDIDDARSAATKIQNRQFQSLTEGERAAMQVLMRQLGGDGGRGGARRGGNQSNADFGGQYVVFVMRDGQPRAVNVRTGLTDLDYSQVIEGINVTDSIMILPSASLIASEQAFQERVSRFTSSPFRSN